MKSNYDLIVIGAGSGGLGVGIGMATFGFDVLMIEKNKANIGGECLNSGCVPSKALIHVAEKVHQARQAQAYGITSGGSVDMQKVMQYVHDKQDDIRAHENAEYLRKNEGVEIEIGEARFKGKREVEVNGKRIKAKKILVATGSHPRMIDVPGMEHVQLFTNENLFEVKTLPQHLLVIGGGPIGMEMGQSFARLGSNVTVTDRGPRIMNKERKEVSVLVKERLEKEGLQFHLNSKLIAFTADKKAVLETSAGERIEIPCDAALVGIGREISYQGLNLENAGIALKDGKPKIDSFLRAKDNKHVVFAGDAAGNVLFSHGAELHTTMLLTNFFAPWPFKIKLNLDHFSWVTFTNPEVATFGFNEAQLKEKGVSYECVDFKFEKDDRATVSDYQYGRMFLYLKKNMLNPRNGKILGGTIVAPAAGEMVQELIMAQQQGLGASAIFNKTYPYPTQTRVHKIALVEKFSGGITPLIKKMFKVLFH